VAWHAIQDMGMNHDTRPLFLLHNDSFTLLNAELNDKQLYRLYILKEPHTSTSNREVEN
jgi:hypothetical protein